MLSENAHTRCSWGGARGEVLREGFEKSLYSQLQNARARSLLFAHTLTRYSGLWATLTRPP